VRTDRGGKQEAGMEVPNARVRNGCRHGDPWGEAENSYPTAGRVPKLGR
jgi:hypothetical protein